MAPFGSTGHLCQHGPTSVWPSKPHMFPGMGPDPGHPHHLRWQQKPWISGPGSDVDMGPGFAPAAAQVVHVIHVGMGPPAAEP